MLRRCIEGIIRGRDQALDGAHIDNPALPLTTHCRQHGVCHAQDAEQVHVEQSLGLRDRGFLRAAEQTNAGIVDKEVDAPSLDKHFIDKFCHGRVIGHVAGQHSYAVGPFGGGATARAKDLEVGGLLPLPAQCQ